MKKKAANSVIVVAVNNDVCFIQQSSLRIRNRDLHFTRFKSGKVIMIVPDKNACIARKHAVEHDPYSGAFRHISWCDDCAGMIINKCHVCNVIQRIECIFSESIIQLY